MYTLYKNRALGNVNQFLFTMTLFHDLSEINWLAGTNFCDQDVDYP